jgi:hypothetical protein
MRILELFAGTASFSRVAKFYGHGTFTVDIDPRFKCDLTTDILDMELLDIPHEFRVEPDILWLSPPCTTFSQAGVWRHWNYQEPKSESAIIALSMIRESIRLIKVIQPRFWFLENPRSVLRKFPEMQNLPRKEVCYCRYGEFRMKPTDIWTNAITWEPKPMCYNGCRDHITAERGSTTGTQGMDPTDSGKIPQLLALEIIEHVKHSLEL